MMPCKLKTNLSLILMLLYMAYGMFLNISFLFEKRSDKISELML